MKISIITVCYNAEKTIANTIDSVISQTYKNIEYVIIDGNSTDKTVSIIKQYMQYVNYFVSEKDSGIYYAMNKGIQAATGDVVFFLNADDIFYNAEVIENIVAQFKIYDRDVVYGDVIICEQDNFCWIKNSQNLDKIFYYDDCLCHQGIFAKKEIFNKFGLFDTRYKISSDYEWFLRVYFKNRIKILHTNLIVSVFKIGGLSSDEKYNFAHEKERDDIQKKYFNWCEKLLLKSGFFRYTLDISLRSIFRKFFNWR